jgi:lysophospholipase L1-like esterase
VLTALAGVLLLHGCSSSQTQPTAPPPVVPDPPKISCPAPITQLSPLGTPISVVYSTATTAGGASPVTTACVPTSGSTFSVGSSSVTCTATDSRQRTDSCAFAITVTAPPRILATKFLAFGDSITAGEVVSEGFGGIRTLRVDPDKAYPADLQRNLASRYTTQAQSIVVENQGRSLEKATEGASRLRGLLARNAYDVVLLMEGANDLADRDWRLGLDALAAMRSMVQSAKGSGTKVFLATLPPQTTGNCPNRGLAYTLVLPYNDGLRDIASAENVQLVDTYQAFGGDTTLIDCDGLHPTPAGYQRIADEFSRNFRDTLEQPPSTPLSISNPFRQSPPFFPRRR